MDMMSTFKNIKKDYENVNIIENVSYNKVCEMMNTELDILFCGTMGTSCSMYFLSNEFRSIKDWFKRLNHEYNQLIKWFERNNMSPNRGTYDDYSWYVVIKNEESK